MLALGVLSPTKLKQRLIGPTLSSGTMRMFPGWGSALKSPCFRNGRGIRAATNVAWQRGRQGRGALDASQRSHRVTSKNAHDLKTRRCSLLCVICCLQSAVCSLLCAFCYAQNPPYAIMLRSAATQQRSSTPPTEHQRQYRPLATKISTSWNIM